MASQIFSRRSLLGITGVSLGATAASTAGRRPGRTAPLAQTGTPAATPTIAYPTGADEVVVRVEDFGGPIPAEWRLSQAPPVSLFGDGRLVTQGPQIAIFPPPALPNLRQLYLTDAGIQLVLDAADAAGLIGQGRRYDNPRVADAWYTVITVNASGQSTRIAVYALGFENPEATPEEQTELAEIQGFVSQLSDVTSWLPPEAVASGDEPFPIERMQVVAAPIDPATTGTDDPAQDREPMDWPIGTPISTFTPPENTPPGLTGLVCGVVIGEEVDRLVAAAQEANVLTPWVSEGEQYRVSFRPLMPDESGCPLLDLGPDPPEPRATPAA